jgi:acyl-CoA synthetase (AMP-forming)/AMP-acid ligase II
MWRWVTTGSVVLIWTKKGGCIRETRRSSGEGVICIYIKGRLNEVIQTTVGSVFPAEVEQRAYECEAVEEAAAKGVERGGETVMAVFVVLKSGRTIQDVLRWAEERQLQWAVRAVGTVPRDLGRKMLRRLLPDVV